MLEKLNDVIAIRATRAFGSMWACWIFAVYGLLPAFAMFRPYQDTFLFYSNAIQLTSLPLIMVGTSLLGRDAERRAAEDHAALIEMHDEVLQILELLREEVAILQKP